MTLNDNPKLETRDYQLRIVNKTIDHLKEHSRKKKAGEVKSDTPATVMIQSPTGSGKTIMAQAVLKALSEGVVDGIKYNSLWMAHRRELLNQANKTNESVFEIPNFQTISMFDKNAERFSGKYKVIVVDECLPADVLVHTFLNGNVINVPIGNIVEDKIGTHVLSMNKQGKLEPKEITSRTCSGIKEIIQLKILVGGKIIALPITANHKIATDKGYIAVSNLNIGDKVFSLASCYETYQIEKCKNYSKTGTDYKRDSFGRRECSNYQIEDNQSPNWSKDGPTQCVSNEQISVPARSQIAVAQTQALPPKIVAGTIIEIECTNTFVPTYDIGVACNHNFFADGVLVHNCQHDASTSAATIHNKIKPDIIIGASATPYRTDRAQLCFQKVIQDAGIRQLIREGWLASFKYMIMDGAWTPENVARVYMQQPDEWGPSVSYFLTVDEAKEMAKLLQRKGIKAEAVLGNAPREEILEAFNRGEIQHLTNCMVLTEGFVAQQLKTVFVRPSSKGPAVQMAGRAFRKHPSTPFVYVVQNHETKYAFSKHAEPMEQWLEYPDGGWRALDDRALLPIVKQMVLRKINTPAPIMPELIQKKTEGTIANMWI